MRNVTTELTFILVAGGVAAIVAVGALVAVIRERRRPRPVSAPTPASEGIDSECGIALRRPLA